MEQGKTGGRGIGRREVSAGLLGAGLLGTLALRGVRPVRAEGKQLNILAHRVMQLALTQGPAGDLTAPWRAASGSELTWTTLDIDPLEDRLFRELTLSETGFGVGFLLNSRATTNAAALLEPLDEMMRKDPIEAWQDVAPGLVQAMTIDGHLIGIPFRHATNGLFYNEALMEARGITAPPKTLEELVDQAKRLTFRMPDGQNVVGIVSSAALASATLVFARAFGGDFITPDFRVIPDREPMIKTIALLRSLSVDGVLPRSYTTITNDDQVTWLQQGRAAFGIMPFSRFAQLNRADQSRYPGRLKAIKVPMSTQAPPGLEMASVVEFWALAIPRNTPDKALAWSFIKAMSAKPVTLGAAINGNGPVRVSTYADPAFAAAQPQAAVEAQSLAKARVTYPAFPEVNRAAAVFVEEVQSAVLGRKTPEQAVDDVIARVRPLLPT
jgi:multiple sugar transport system substrate-binding protein